MIIYMNFFILSVYTTYDNMIIQYRLNAQFCLQVLLKCSIGSSYFKKVQLGPRIVKNTSMLLFLSI